MPQAIRPMSRRGSQVNGRKDQDQTQYKHQVPRESNTVKNIHLYKWTNQLWKVTN